MYLLHPFLLFLLLMLSTNIQAQDWLLTQDHWGGTDSTNSTYEHEIEFITIHHGGEIFADDKNTVEYLRNLQLWSRRSKKWIDLPYHYIIARNGEIYQGRPLKYKGDTNTSYDPTGHALIVLLGNFEEQELREEQIASLKTVSTYLVGKYEIPKERIKTHRDYTETLCPGKKLTAYLNSYEWNKFLNSL